MWASARCVKPSTGLQQRNWYAFEDQKGFHVAGVGSEDLADLIRTRCWIEEIVAPRIHREW